MNSIDTEALKEAFEWIVPDMVDAVRPVAYAVIPSLINGLCEMLTPQTGDDTEEHEKALDTLRRILSAHGGGK